MSAAISYAMAAGRGCGTRGGEFTPERGLAVSWAKVGLCESAGVPRTKTGRGTQWHPFFYSYIAAVRARISYPCQYRFSLGLEECKRKAYGISRAQGGNGA